MTVSFSRSNSIIRLENARDGIKTDGNVNTPWRLPQLKGLGALVRGHKGRHLGESTQVAGPCEMLQ